MFAISFLLIKQVSFTCDAKVYKAEGLYSVVTNDKAWDGMNETEKNFILKNNLIIVCN